MSSTPNMDFNAANVFENTVAIRSVPEHPVPRRHCPTDGNVRHTRCRPSRRAARRPGAELAICWSMISTSTGRATCQGDVSSNKVRPLKSSLHLPTPTTNPYPKCLQPDRGPHVPRPDRGPHVPRPDRDWKERDQGGHVKHLIGSRSPQTLPVPLTRCARSLWAAECHQLLVEAPLE